MTFENGIIFGAAGAATRQVVAYFDLAPASGNSFPGLEVGVTRLENDLGEFQTDTIHVSDDFVIREYLFSYREDCRLSFHTGAIDYLEISFFFNEIAVVDIFDRKEREYLPLHAYVHYTPAEADAEIIFWKGREYRNLDIYLSLTFFHEWANSNPYIDQFLKSIENQERATLFPSGIPITSDMAMALSEIKNCSLSGISRRFFIRAQVLRLLSLLFAEGHDKVMKALNDVIRAEDLEILTKIRDLIHSESDKFYTIEYLSRQFGINKSKLKKGFRDQFGKGLFEYSTEVRMKSAMELIVNSKYPLKEIAFKVGYSSASSFCVAFKRQFGMSPVCFRQ